MKIFKAKVIEYSKVLIYTKMVNDMRVILLTD